MRPIAEAHSRMPIASPLLWFGVENSVEEIISELVESSFRNGQADLRQPALTGIIIDVSSLGYCKSEAKNFSPTGYQKIATKATEAAHIILFSLRSFTESTVKPFPVPRYRNRPLTSVGIPPSPGTLHVYIGTSLVPVLGSISQPIQ